MLYWGIAIGRRNLDLDNYVIEIPKSEERIRKFAVEMCKRLMYLYGRSKLNNETHDSIEKELIAFLLTCNTEELFDFIELSFRLPRTSLTIHDPTRVVDLINENFNNEKIPYRLTPFTPLKNSEKEILYPQVIQTEDEVIYKESIEPALSILSLPHFKVANTEFLDALNDYRKGDYTDCLTKCRSAFESVLKVLCERNKWSPSKDTIASHLEIVIQESRLHSFYKDPLLIVATMRNKLSSAHGGGSKERKVEPHIAQYAVSSTAAAIVLLVHHTNKHVTKNVWSTSN